MLLNERYSKSGKSVLFKFDIGEETWASMDNKFNQMAFDIRKYYPFGKFYYISLSLSVLFPACVNFAIYMCRLFDYERVARVVLVFDFT